MQKLQNAHELEGPSLYKEDIIPRDQACDATGDHDLRSCALSLVVSIVDWHFYRTLQYLIAELLWSSRHPSRLRQLRCSFERDCH